MFSSISEIFQNIFVKRVGSEFELLFVGWLALSFHHQLNPPPPVFPTPPPVFSTHQICRLAVNTYFILIITIDVAIIWRRPARIRPNMTFIFHLPYLLSPPNMHQHIFHPCLYRHHHIMYRSWDPGANRAFGQLSAKYREKTDKISYIFYSAH